MVVALVTAMLATSVTSASAQPSTPSGRSAAVASACSPANARATWPWTITPQITDNLNKVVEVPNGSTANGVQLDQWTDQGKDWEQWTVYDCGLSSLGFPLVAFKNDATQKCMNVAGGSMSNGAAIIQYGCQDGNGNFFSNNLWVVNFNNWDIILSAYSGLCLNVSGGSTSNGGRMIQWTCSPDPNNPYPNEVFYTGRA
jgi:hypothetical protein